MATLSPEQQEAYWRDGYVVVKGLFSDDELAAWHARVRELARGDVAPSESENGCLAVLPGSHEGKLLPHDMPDWDWVNAGYLGAQGFDASDRVHVPMDRGDTPLFHSFLIHGSGTNRTDGFRRIVSTHYAQTGCDDLWEGRDEISTRPWIPVRGEGAETTASA